jgi:hypothetical protein
MIAFTEESQKPNPKQEVTPPSEAATYCGVLGTALAVAISYTAYKSIAWAILHGCCGWLFVLWYWLTQT